ncbi:MAG: DUF4432 family protein [Microbacteriaceae bacterium]
MPTDDLLASAESAESAAGRTVTARTFLGWEVQLLPDRGLDIGAAHLGGLPVSWFSPVRDRRPLPAPRGEQWLERFTGGLLTTCGLRGFGPAQGDRGLHGDIGHRPSGQVAVTRAVTADRATLELRAEVLDARVFDATLLLSRTVRLESSADGPPAVTVEDVLTNLGPVCVDIGVLYHLNLGAPFLVPGARIEVDAAEPPAARAPDASIDPAVFPEPRDGLDEHVVEWRGLAQSEGVAHARVHGGHGIRLDVSWSADTLPVLGQWMFPARGRWALGIEPATSSLLDGTAPMPRLDAGASRRHRVRIEGRLPLPGRSAPGRPEPVTEKENQR